MYNATQANKYTCKQVDGDERQHSPALTISVTRCWNKKVAQIFQKLAQKKPMHFYILKKWHISKYPKNQQIFGQFL